MSFTHNVLESQSGKINPWSNLSPEFYLTGKADLQIWHSVYNYWIAQNFRRLKFLTINPSPFYYLLKHFGNRLPRSYLVQIEQFWKLSSKALQDYTWTSSVETGSGPFAHYHIIIDCSKPQVEEIIDKLRIEFTNQHLTGSRRQYAMVLSKKSDSKRGIEYFLGKKQGIFKDDFAFLIGNISTLGIQKYDLAPVVQPFVVEFEKFQKELRYTQRGYISEGDESEEDSELFPVHELLT